MSSTDLIAVTGAFSYSGRYVARRLLDRGYRVITLTNHPGRRDPFNGAVKAMPLSFDDADELKKALDGVSVLVNTYWVRFAYGNTTHQVAVENSRKLFEAAKAAGVGRVVHTSIANPSADSPLTYYRGKWAVEQALVTSGLSYAILRPAVLYGGETPAEDVLINNIAWILRRSPAFGLPGDGAYGIQPIHVADYADFVVEQVEASGSQIADACGPEAFPFRDLVKRVAQAVGGRALIVSMPPMLALAAAQVISRFVGDVVLTREEVIGLMDNLLVSQEAPVGKVRISEWIDHNASLLGTRYASEVGRHFK